MKISILEAVQSEICRNLVDADYLEERMIQLLQSGEFSQHELNQIVASCREKAAKLQVLLDKKSQQADDN